MSKDAWDNVEDKELRDKALRDADDQDEWNDDYVDETDSEDDEEIAQEKKGEKFEKIAKERKVNKRKWKEGEKQKFKDKEKTKVERTNLKYDNIEIVNKVDDIVEGLLKDNYANKYRDHLFPELINKMGLLYGAEIGVDKGQFSEHILSKTKINVYYCIDTWQDNFGSDCKPGYFDKSGNVRFNQAKEILDKYAPRSIMIRKTSIEASKDIANSGLDFCYIDGDHSLQGIYEDLRYWVPKVRVGGIVSGHDYKNGPRSGVTDYFGRQLDYNIKSVVDDYCARNGFPLRTLGGRILNWYFVKNRNAQ